MRDSLRILFITDRSPYPPGAGHLLRIYNLCRRLGRDHELWLATRLNEPAEQDGLDHMAGFCHTILSAPRPDKSRVGYLPGLARYALHGKPWEYYFEEAPQLETQIRQVLQDNRFDVVHIEPSYMALYREAMPRDAQARTFLTFHNVESQLYQRQARVTDSQLGAWRAYAHSWALSRWEATYPARFDCCITVSEEDRRQLAAHPGVRAVVSPNGVDTGAYPLLPPADGPPRLLFVGSMNYRPCVDGMLFFCNQVLPRLRELVPQVELWIVGRNPTPEIQALAGPHIHVTGWVDDVQPYYAQSTAVIVPLRAGGGTRLKVVEAMALGRAMVSTSLGCEGIDVEDGRHLLIADTPEEFARQTARLLTEPDLRRDLVRAARGLAEERYDWDAIVNELVALYRESAAWPPVAEAEKGATR